MGHEGARFRIRDGALDLGRGHIRMIRMTRAPDHVPIRDRGADRGHARAVDRGPDLADDRVAVRNIANTHRLRRQTLESIKSDLAIERTETKTRNDRVRGGQSRSAIRMAMDIRTVRDLDQRLQSRPNRNEANEFELESVQFGEPMTVICLFQSCKIHNYSRVNKEGKQIGQTTCLLYTPIRSINTHQSRTESVGCVPM